ncbi:uncharacterized protein LOC131695363 [Topomyia yanbarensis]|uniref:uncharacterized protein LOC131695363 n=1 Tax=Topomyia yanbarensis TaxID=2498891 RepID=UPI00273C42C4|nr:uncharacterized protein LOC131695363 [Topomyia yanbarensis]
MSCLLNLGGFQLRKWCSNFPAALDGIPHEDLATQSSRTFDPEETIKTLGISWEPSSDLFRFDINTNAVTEPITKRSILSAIARLYDPLGLIAPIIIRAKMLLQLLWTLSLDWDEDVPGEVQTRWKGFASELPDLSSYRISRYAFGEGDIQLHCFADASKAVYGTCVYARSVDALGGVKVELIASKSRVGPLKRRSIPRLELCAVQLAAHLYEKDYSALDMKFSSVWFWSDSTVVLHWLSSPPHTWKAFIANRVADIQETTRGGKWCHVPGATNPADLVSRDMTVEQLGNISEWRHGLHWMQGELDDWPKQNWITSTTHSHEELERKHSVLTIQTPTLPNPLVARFSSYLKMVRTTAYCLRFFFIMLEAENEQPLQYYWFTNWSEQKRFW